MELRSINGEVIFVLKKAKTIAKVVGAAHKNGADLSGAYLRGAVLKGADLSGADLSGAYLRDAYLSGAYLSGTDLSGADLRGAVLKGAYLRGADLRDAYLSGAVLSGAILRGTDLSGADLRGAIIDGRKIAAVQILTGLYAYEAWAVLFQDGSRWVRMGCLWKSIEEWDRVGIRNSNISEFPDDGSEKCEERVAAFEFAKAAALRLK